MVEFNIFVVHYSKLVERKQNIKKSLTQII